MQSFAHLFAALVLGGFCNHLLILAKLHNLGHMAEGLRLLGWSALLGLVVFMAGLPWADSLMFACAAAIGAGACVHVIARGVDRVSLLNDGWFALGAGLALFLPPTVMGWVLGLFWPKILLCAFGLPACYLMAPNMLSRPTDWDRAERLAGLMFGALVGFFLTDAVIVAPWVVWPAVPHVFQVLDPTPFTGAD